MTNPQFLRHFFRRKKRNGVGNGMTSQLPVQSLQIERQILNAPFAKLHIRESQTAGHDRSVAARDLQHIVGHVDADDFPLRADNLRGDETDFSRPAAQIEDGFARV